MQGKQFILTPRLNETVCRLADAEANAHLHHAAPGRRSAGDAADQRPDPLTAMRAAWGHTQRTSPVPKQYGGLPTLDGFTFHNSEMVRGQPAEEWRYTHQVQSRHCAHSQASMLAVL